jgi:hypothetical protein
MKCMNIGRCLTIAEFDARPSSLRQADRKKPTANECNDQTNGSEKDRGRTKPAEVERIKTSQDIE